MVPDIELHKDSVLGPELYTVSVEFSDLAENLNVRDWSL